MLNFTSIPHCLHCLICRLYHWTALQFCLFLLGYLLLLVMVLAEEFKHSPGMLQQFCCWIHENNSMRNIVTVTAIAINFGMALFDMVRLFVQFLKKLNFEFCDWL